MSYLPEDKSLVYRLIEPFCLLFLVVTTKIMVDANQNHLRSTGAKPNFGDYGMSVSISCLNFYITIVNMHYLCLVWILSKFKA